MVLQKESKDVLSYLSVEDLVETHIKGLLATQQPDSDATRELLAKYHSKASTQSDIDS